MSNLSVGNVQGTMTLNANQFVSGANQAVGALKQLELATAANWWGLRNLGVALAAIPAAVATGVGASINAYMEWEDAIASVERTTYRAQTATETAAQANERNAKTLSGIVDGLKEIASVTPVAAGTLAEIASSAGALGVAEDDIVAFTKVVADLAATTDLTANSAATNLARIAGLTGVAGQGYDNLASSILEVGRSTQATEQEIVDIANRIAGVASIANISAAEVIGWAGAIRSAGVNAEAGGTAFQKSFIDVYTAVKQGGDELEIFARTANMSMEEFRTAFESDSSGTFIKFLEGLGQVQAQGGNVIAILEALGITEQRQIRALLSLAEAQTQQVNVSQKASFALETSNKAFADGTAIAEIAAKRYRTLSSQIQVLRNEVFLAAQGFGATFAPVISFVVMRLREFLAGLQALPQPLKIAVGVILGVTVALLGLASAAILIGPRLVLAVAAIRQLGTSSGATVGGLAGLTGGMGSASTAAQGLAASAQLATTRVAALNSATALAATSMLGGSAASAASGASQLGQSAAAATTGLSGMALWAGRLGKGLGILGAVLTVGSILLTVFGAKLRDNTSAITDTVSANGDLYNILVRNNNAVDESTASWLKQSDMWPRIQAGLGRYGQTLEEVQALVQGTASSDQYQKFLADTSRAYEAGDKGAKDYADAVIYLSRTFGETRKEVESVVGPLRDVIDVNEEAKDSFKTDEQIRELEKLRRALEDQARSHVDYVAALQTQQRAQFDLIDAQRAYNEALSNAQDPTRVLGELERRLANARRNSEKSQEALAKAEIRLSTAREDQQKSLAEALEDVTDAQESYSDAQRKLQDAEEELAELRKGPELKNIVKATNDLRNAQLRLLRANQDVADAEWYLTYLREEGASNRDIKDAELALEEARQEVANTNQEIAESEEELQRAREGASARELADAEEAVSDALRATQDAYDEIIEKEAEVSEIRQAIANDTAFREAERDLAEARDNVAEATSAVADAETELRNARDFGISRDLRQAELDLSDAIFQTAQANAEARIAQLRMNGVYVDAGTEAAILADELGRMVRLAPTAAQQNRLREFVNILRSAPESGPPVEQQSQELDYGDALDPVQMPIPLAPDLDQFTSEFENFADQVPGAVSNIWREVWEEYKGEIGAIVVTAIVGGIVAALIGIPVGLATAIVALVYWIANTFGNDFVAFMREIVLPKIGDFFTKTLPKFLTDTVPRGFQRAMTAVRDFLWNFFTDTLPNLFLDLVPQAFITAIDLFYNGGLDLLGGLVSGLDAAWDSVYNFMRALPGRVRDAIGFVGSTLFEKGRDLINGIGNGIVAAYVTVAGYMINLPGRLRDALGDLAYKFYNRGVEIIQGILNGLGAAAVSLANWFIRLPGNLFRYMGDLVWYFYDAGWNIVQGILDGIWDAGAQIGDLLIEFAKDAWRRVKSWFGIHSPSTKMAWIGEMMMRGLTGGIEDYSKGAVEAAGAVAADTLAAFNGMSIDAALNDMLNTEAARFSVASGTAASASGLTAAPSTVINEGDTFNLEATTTADPAAIVDEFMWAKMVRI